MYNITYEALSDAAVEAGSDIEDAKSIKAALLEIDRNLDRMFDVAYSGAVGTSVADIKDMLAPLIDASSDLIGIAERAWEDACDQANNLQ